MAQRYLEDLANDALTAQIDQALAVAGEDGARSAAVAAGHRRLGREGDW